MLQTYSVDHYKVIQRASEKHFWFKARSHLIRNVILRTISRAKNASFLEIGFGTGLVLRELEALGLTLYGIDVNQKAVDIASSFTKAELIRSSLYTYKTSRRFDALGAFDVLEHQSDDLRFLRKCKELLVKDGLLYLTVPARGELWAKIDDYSGHKRRYSHTELIGKLEKTGFEVVYWNYWQVLLLPFYALWRRSVHSSPKIIEAYIGLPPKILNTLFFIILLLEQVFIFRIIYPFGASLIVVAKKVKPKMLEIPKK